MENGNILYQMKQVTHIYCPPEWESTNDWDSHKSLLYLSCEKTKGVIVEAGMGDGSTKLLHDYFSQRPVAHLDNNKEWIIKLSKENAYLNAIYVNNWIEDNLFPEEIGLLFVDFAPGELRKDFIAKWADKADVIVAHDTEPGANYVYGMAEVLSTFKYRLNYCPEGKPWTTAVSNFVNIEEWV